LALSWPSLGPLLALSWPSLGLLLALSWPSLGPLLAFSWPSHYSHHSHHSHMCLCCDGHSIGAQLARLGHWLAFTLEELFFVTDTASDPTLPERRTELLSAVANLAQVCCETPPVMLEFLERFLPLWDGRTHLDAILSLIAYLSPLELVELQRCVLRALQKHLLHGSSLLKVGVLVCVAFSGLAVWFSFSFE